MNFRYRHFRGLVNGCIEADFATKLLILKAYCPAFKLYNICTLLPIWLNSGESCGLASMCALF